MADMELTERFSLRLTKEESEKLSNLARKLKVRRSDVVRILIEGADIQHRVVSALHISEIQEDYQP